MVTLQRLKQPVFMVVHEGVIVWKGEGWARPREFYYYYRLY